MKELMEQFKPLYEAKAQKRLRAACTKALNKNLGMKDSVDLAAMIYAKMWMDES